MRGPQRANLEQSELFCIAIAAPMFTTRDAGYRVVRHPLGEAALMEKRGPVSTWE